MGGDMEQADRDVGGMELGEELGCVSWVGVRL